VACGRAAAEWRRRTRAVDRRARRGATARNARAAHARCCTRRSA
jgi:hypothetical protein